MKVSNLVQPVVVAMLSTLSLKSGAQQYPYKNKALPIEQRVKDLLSRMSRLEKIKQLDMYRGFEFAPMGEAHEATIYNEDTIAKALGKYSVGTMHDFYPLYSSLSNKVQEYVIKNSRWGIPVLFVEEGLHGYSGKGSTSFPIPLGLAATWDTDLIYKVGRAIAMESRANGTAMILGPLLDVARDPRWGRMEETFGEDTYLVSEIGLAIVKGLQGGDVSRHDAVVSEPKHFAGHAFPEAGSNTAPVNIGPREMRTVFLPTFEKAVKKGKALGIMAAYHETDGVPSVSNKWLLTDILRKEWGFKGMVVSDLGAIRMTQEVHKTASDRGDALAQSLNAGLDMQFYDYSHTAFEQSIDSAINKKMITEARLDSAVANVLRVKFLLGLFERPYIDTTLWAKVKNSAAHQQIALQAAQRSVTLLKNENNILPLSNTRKIAVVGPLGKSNYLGGYSNTEDTAVSLLTGLKRRAGAGVEINYAEGISKQNKTALEDAINLVRQSDVAIVALGENLEEVGEGKDRAHLDLDSAQLNLIQAIQKAGKPVVVVLMNGRALCFNWIADNTPAIVEGWFNGEKSGLAMADVLLGNINPSGKLPITFPCSVGQIPFYYNHNPSSHHNYVDEKDKPLYAFGHGLSYTTFQYSGLVLPTKPITKNGSFVVRLKVKNTGNIAGEEVVQLYIRDEVSSVATPVTSLKAFSRVALNAGETKELVFNIDVEEALSLWNRDLKKVVEPGKFKMMIGSSSDDIRLNGQITVN